MHQREKLEQNPRSGKDPDSTVRARGSARGKRPRDRTLDACLVNGVRLAATPSEKYERAAAATAALGGPRRSLHRSGGRCAGIPRSPVDLSDTSPPQLQPAPHKRPAQRRRRRALRLPMHDACHMIHARACATHPGVLLASDRPMWQLSKAVGAGVCLRPVAASTLVPTHRSRRAGADQSRRPQQHRRRT